MPKITFLPYNVAEPVRPALGRQLASFVRESIKDLPGIEANYLSAMAELGEGDDREAAFVNFSDSLNDIKLVTQLIEQSQSEYLVDGLLTEIEPGYHLTMRVLKSGANDFISWERDFLLAELFDAIKWMFLNLREILGDAISEEFVTNFDFGTDNPDAFREFLVGFDAVAYLQQARERRAKTFDIGAPFESLLSAVEWDKEFLGPYEAAVQLSRLCAEFNVGSPTLVEEKLNRLVSAYPNDWRAHYTLAEILFGTGRMNEATGKFEKAIFLMEKAHADALKEAESGNGESVPPLEAALYTRLGMAQQSQGMVVNAERSYRKAVDLEGAEKPSLDFLSGLLAQTGRAHEVPSLWKEVVDTYPKSGQAWAKYAIALLQSEKEPDAAAAFEEGLEKSEDTAWVKRYYAPYLAGKDQFDRAMDFYEDCIDVAPKDVGLLMEYAQVLAKAERPHEIPDTLNAILAADPDPNVKAQTLAWLYELEQPRRVEAIASAQERIEKEDLSGAVTELEPLIEWMQDYWKPWAMLASLYNQLGRFEDAERAANHLIGIFPGLDSGYCDLAAALSGQGRHDEAYQTLTFALRSLPNSLPIALNLALAANRVGQTEEALRLASQIREVAKGNIEIERALAEITGR
jgi:tetratricopeptide (TPR) repeat protein